MKTNNKVPHYHVDIYGQYYERSKHHDPYYADMDCFSRPILDSQREWDGVPHGGLIDLGLPSGTLWASKNLGAIDVDDPGYYFAWGEIKPKQEYAWNTYKFYRKDKLTKYVYRSRYSGPCPDDGKLFLELCDDAAVHEMGPKWRVPTLQQANELKNVCKWQQAISHNEIRGVAVVGPNGNSIFLPYTGRVCGKGMMYVAEEGNIMTSFINFASPIDVRPLSFGDESVGFDILYRCEGIPIRPVYIG